MRTSLIAVLIMAFFVLPQSINGSISIVNFFSNVNAKQLENQTKIKKNPESFVGAAAAGDLSGVKLLLQKGIDVNVRALSGMTALLAACQNNHIEMVAYLLSVGASMELTGPNDGEDTNAETFGFIGIMKDEKTIRGSTPLFIASQNGSADIVKLLLEKKANVDSPSANGATPLYIACQLGNSEIVRILLNAKADPNRITNYGWTPLMVAACKGDIDCAEALIDIGAEVNHTGSMFMISRTMTNPMNDGMKEVKSITALYIAALAEKIEIVKLLLSRGADPDLITSSGETPLDAAKFMENEAIIQLLSKGKSE